jgi:hypothetical protein
MMKLGEIFGYSAKHGLNYTEKLLVGISREKFARFACPGDQPIRSNHPSFIIGHLSLYGPRILSDLGLPSELINIPDSFVKAYSKDAQCVDDPNCDIYPSMEEVVETYFESYRVAIDQIKSVPNEAYEKPNRNAGAIARFPTVADMHGFYMSGHMMLHLGQLSAWRRAAGLAPA